MEPFLTARSVPSIFSPSPLYGSMSCHATSDQLCRSLFLLLARSSIFRTRSNSFGCRRTSGLTQLVLEHGSPHQMTMSAARGSAVLCIGELRGPIERCPRVRNLCIACVWTKFAPSARHGRYGSRARVRWPIHKFLLSYSESSHCPLSKPMGSPFLRSTSIWLSDAEGASDKSSTGFNEGAVL